MLEHELKFAATKDDIEALRKKLAESEKTVSVKRGVQINFYYDTDSRSFLSGGTTVRIRQKESGLKLQIKRHNYYGSNKNLETAEKIYEIPNTMTVEGQTVKLMGELVTDRTRHILDNGVKIDLDINFYCGLTDYEIEAELPEGMEDADGIKDFFDGLKPAVSGKVSRFYMAKKLLENK